MENAQLTALLYRAAHSGRRYGGVLERRHVAAVENRLLARARERMGAFGRFVDRSEPTPWNDSRTAFPDAEGDSFSARHLLFPAWLLGGWGSRVTGQDAAGVHVVATRRPAARMPVDTASMDAAISRLDIVVDPDRGVLLRVDAYLDDDLCRTAELVDLRELPSTSADFDKRTARADREAGAASAEAGAAGAGRDADDGGHGPDAAPDIDGDGDGDEFEVPGAIRSVARGLGAAIGGVVRLSARLSAPHEPGADDEPWFAEEDLPDVDGEPLPSDGELAALLHRGPRDRDPFGARLDIWTEPKRLAERLGGEINGALGGLLGPEAMWTAFGDAAPERAHLARRVVFTDLLHYRLEAVRDPAGSRRGPTAVTCDGERVYRRFPDRLVLAEAAPPDFEAARMLDPSWLPASGAVLAATGWTRLDGRRALRLTAASGDGDDRDGLPAPSFLFRRLEAVLDADLGVLLRLTWLDDDGTPAGRSALREVRAMRPVPEVFRLTAPPNGRTVTDTGGPFGSSGLPPVVKTVAGAAGVVAGGAVMLAGLLGRPREPERDPGHAAGPRRDGDEAER